MENLVFIITPNHPYLHTLTESCPFIIQWNPAFHVLLASFLLGDFSSIIFPPCFQLILVLVEHDCNTLHE